MKDESFLNYMLEILKWKDHSVSLKGNLSYLWFNLLPESIRTFKKFPYTYHKALKNLC